MTDVEKKVMLTKIMAAPAVVESVAPSIQAKSIKSPWTVYSFRMWIERNRWSYIAIALLIVLVAGTGVASAAQSSLPGDALYPIKTDVTEPLRVALAPTPEAKAQVEASIATTRLEEAETLAAQGKLDASKQAQIQTSLDVYSAKFNSSIAQAEAAGISLVKKVAISATTTPTASTTINSAIASLPTHLEELKMDFHAALDAHARVLDLIGSVEASTTDKAAASNIADSARKNATAFGLGNNTDNGGTRNKGNTTFSSSPVTHQNHKGNGKSDRAGDTYLNLTNTPQAQTIEATTSATSSDVINGPDMNGYGHHRQSVQSLIHDTQSNLDHLPTSTDQTWNQMVASGTMDALNQANQSLDAADQENMNGQATSASHTLLQSEKSATEANIFLNTGLKFGQIFGDGNNSRNHGNGNHGN